MFKLFFFLIASIFIFSCGKKDEDSKKSAPTVTGEQSPKVDPKVKDNKPDFPNVDMMVNQFKKSTDKFVDKTFKNLADARKQFLKLSETLLKKKKAMVKEFEESKKSWAKKLDKFKNNSKLLKDMKAAKEKVMKNYEKMIKSLDSQLEKTKKSLKNLDPKNVVAEMKPSVFPAK